MAIPEVPNDMHWIVGFDAPKLPQNPHEALRARFEIFLRTKLNIAPTQDDYIAVIEDNTAISNRAFNELRRRMGGLSWANGKKEFGQPALRYGRKTGKKLRPL